MANKVTANDITSFNELYLKHKTYAAVARETGFSASTVKRYIQTDYVSKDAVIKRPLSQEKIDSIEKYIMPLHTVSNTILKLNDDEINEIIDLWEELSI